MGQFSFLQFWGFGIFGRFCLWPFFAIFCIFGVPVEILGVVKSYKITWTLGGPGGSAWPLYGYFAPLEVFYGTRFGSKLLILVQLAYIYREGISGPYVDLWGPLGGSQKTIHKIPYHRVQNAFYLWWSPRWSNFDNPNDLWHLTHWLQFWWLNYWIHNNLCYLTIKSDTGQHSQFLRCFRGQKARFVTSWGLKMARFAPKWTFWSSQGGPKRSTNGSMMPFLYILASWTIMSCLEPNLVPYKTSREAISVL